MYLCILVVGAVRTALLHVWKEATVLAGLSSLSNVQLSL